MRKRLVLGGLLAALTATGARAECKLITIADLPVTMTRQAPIVTAKINGAQARFIVDSGAFYSTISPAIVAQYGLTSGPTAASEVRGVGGATKSSITKVARFTIAGATIKNVPFLVARDMTGGEFTGFLGQNLLGIGDVDYDLANGAIRLMRPSDCGHAMLAYWAKPDQPFGSMDLEQDPSGAKFTVGTVTVNGKRIKALFDTGTGVSVLTLSAARRIGIPASSMVAAGSVGGIGGAFARTWIAPVAEIDIGGEKIEHTHVRIADYSAVGGDMLVGADFFLSHRVFVANSQHKLYFTYSGGPVFNLDSGAPAAAAPAAEVASGDASVHARRGAALMARREYASAAAEFSRAIELAPKDGDYLSQRGQARMALNQGTLARADLDAAVALAPDDPAARIARAQLRFYDVDKTPAIHDLDAADKVLAKQADERLELANLYVWADALPAAIGQFGLWIDAHPTDTRLPEVLNGRCWARAMAGQDLAGALADCDKALRRAPKNPAFLDSRGLAHLRMGDLDKAIADYDQALAAQPKLAWSLYGRGLARLKKGQSADGKADIAAAIAIDPKLPDRAKKFGLVP